MRQWLISGDGGGRGHDRGGRGGRVVLIAFGGSLCSSTTLQRTC